jgi:sugar O-acyltransferase (sialic acid O-acetyltransferase NeuD family)
MRNQEKLQIVVYGAGGHASVVLDVLASQGCWKVEGLLDDQELLWGSALAGTRILGGRDLLDGLLRRGIERAIVAVGDNRTRRDLQCLLVEKGFELVAAVAAFSSVGSGVVLGPGSAAMPGCVINANAVIGRGAIVNTGATIDHDCRVGDFAHISPGAHLAGKVSVGELTHIGAGAAILPGVSIGREAVVGAGAVVLKDLMDRVTAVGVPARVMARALQLGVSPTSSLFPKENPPSTPF